jgi:hypothetical protein
MVAKTACPDSQGSSGQAIPFWGWALAAFRPAITRDTAPPCILKDFSAKKLLVKLMKNIKVIKIEKRKHL